VQNVQGREQVGVPPGRLDGFSRHGQNILKALFRGRYDENFEVVTLPGPSKETLREEQLERAELAVHCLQGVCPQVDLEEAALHPPARVMELKVAVRQERQPTAAGAILDPKLPGAEVAVGDPGTKGDRPWAKQRQDVGPDRRNGQAVFDEKLARAVQAPTVGRRVVGARSLVEKAQAALGERIKERTPSTDDAGDGALNPLDEPPEPELVETVVGAGGGPLVRASGGKEGKIDQIEG